MNKCDIFRVYIHAGEGMVKVAPALLRFSEHAKLQHLAEKWFCIYIFWLSLTNKVWDFCWSYLWFYLIISIQFGIIRKPVDFPFQWFVRNTHMWWWPRKMRQITPSHFKTVSSSVGIDFIVLTCWGIVWFTPDWQHLLFEQHLGLIVHSLKHPLSLC